MINDQLTIQCATCFEAFDIEVDPSGGSEQEFVIDCEVCCRPMTVRLHVDERGMAYAEVNGD